MGLVIPSSKNKNYLSGMDWVMGVLDNILKEKTGIGNISQIVFKLNSRLEEAEFQTELNCFLRQFPILQGKISRAYNLAPYWKIPSRISDDSLLKIHHLEHFPLDAALIPFIEKCINQPLLGNNHLAFHLIYPRDLPCYLVMTFDHLMFDARGAELFVDLFQQYLEESEDFSLTNKINLTTSADLSLWLDKFRAGRQINRKFIALSQTSIRGLPLPNQGSKKDFKFKIISFNQLEAKNIINQAYKEAGILMEMPFLLATVLQIVHQLFLARGISASSYLVPVSIDKRLGKDNKKEIFFNYTSFLFIQVEKEVINNRKELIKIIKEQMYEQIQLGMPENLRKASALLRIAPLSALKKVFNIPFEGKTASFCFSHVGMSSYRSLELMNRKVVNLFHMPRVPLPPGFGVFFNSFNGQLNATISWLDGLLSDEEVGSLEKNLVNGLTICRDS